MTIIRRLYSEPSDILGIQLACKNCGSTIVLNRLRDWTPTPMACPNCSTTLVRDGNSKELDLLRDVAESFKRLLAAKEWQLPFVVRFELKDPSEDDGR
jgi:hypothetical protein